MRLAKLICATALCLALLGAGTASAFEWAISGKSLEELKLKSESVSGKAPSAVEIAAENGIKVKCESAAAEGLAIVAVGGIEGTIVLSGCTVPGSKTCTVEPIKLKVIGQFAERYGETFVVFKGSGSPELGTVFFSGAFCVIPEEEPLAGTIAGQLSTGESTERVIAFSTAAGKAAGTSLKLGNSLASVSAGKLGLSLSGANKGKGWGAAGGAGLGPGAELSFVGSPVGTVKTITVENVGLPLSTVTMRGEWIERSGVVDEGDFLIVPAGGAEACAMPFKKEKGTTFESLIGNGAKCKVGVEFISGITGVPGEAYVLEYGPYIFWPNYKRFTVKA